MIWINVTVSSQSWKPLYFNSFKHSKACAVELLKGELQRKNVVRYDEKTSVVLVRVRSED